MQLREEEVAYLGAVSLQVVLLIEVSGHRNASQLVWPFRERHHWQGNLSLAYQSFSRDRNDTKRGQSSSTACT